MEFQGNRVFNVEAKYIDTPTNDEFVTIWRNKLDNKYYGRRADGTDEPIGGGASVGVDCFNQKINGPFDTNDVPSTFGQCFIDLPAGDYIFDLDVTAKRTSLLNPFGQTVAEIRINTNIGPNVDPSDILLESRESYLNLASTDESYSIHLMTGKVQVGGQFTFKAAFWDGLDGDMNVRNIMMRAIKIA